METSILRALKVVLALLLFACLLDWPYGYFMFVRVAATIGFTLFAHAEWKAERIPTLILFIGLAVLFQPLVKIALGRELWNIVDVVVGIGLLGWVALERPSKD